MYDLPAAGLVSSDSRALLHIPLWMHWAFLAWQIHSIAGLLLAAAADILPARLSSAPEIRWSLWLPGSAQLQNDLMVQTGLSQCSFLKRTGQRAKVWRCRAAWALLSPRAELKINKTRRRDSIVLASREQREPMAALLRLILSLQVRSVTYL